ncbi:hypothetical protein SESBI_08175 [Sesbania bispinosa]|nr:hypothetical protein SESBI_08175 [Sesbania bispinosa]
MATSSPLHLPELHFLSPQITPKCRLSLSKFPSSTVTCSISCHSSSNVTLRTTRIQAVKEESALAERVNDVEWSGNSVAAASGRNDSGNGAIEGYVNGTTNGSMVKFDYGNGVAVQVVEVEASKLNEDGRKIRLEEIGKEDAWFKQIGKERVEVGHHFGFEVVLIRVYMKYERVIFRK